MKYFIYCRKSSEEEERQALSIESQLQELREYARKYGLIIVDEFIESKSARKPKNRPIFDEMLSKIETGIADGILSWAPDRLSRNAKEGGSIIDFVDQGIIKDLKFPSFHFQPDPQGLFHLSLAFSFGKLYVDNLSQNVRRGIREKVRRGEFPGPAPIGYINNLRKKNIEADPENFELIKKLIENYANGNLSFSEIANKMFQAGLKTRNGNRVSYNTVQRILTSPFYYGVFKLKGELYQGSHPPMISKETFDKAQKRLKDKIRSVDWSKKRKNDKGFLFTDIGKCGECGYSMIQDYHRKKSGLEFRYYRCSKKSKTHKCTQKAINEKNLAEQIEGLVSEISIDDYWYEWCMNEIRTWRDKEKDSIDVQIGELKNELKAYQERLEKLLDIHIEGVIDSKEYKSKKNKIINDCNVIEGKISKIQAGSSDWFEPLAKSLQTGNEAFHSVLEKNYTRMGRILKIAGSNPSFLGQAYSLTYTHPFCFFREAISKTRIHNSPELTTLDNKLEIQTRNGDCGTRSCVSSSSAAASLSLRSATIMGASEPQASERFGLGSARSAVSEWQPLVDAFRNREIEFAVAPHSANRVLQA